MRVVWFKVEKYLLDSALTLSISPIRVTSLSIRLEQNRRKKILVDNIYCNR